MRITVSAVVVATLVCGWAFAVTSRAVRTGFHLDDVTNLYRAWEQPAWNLATANLTPFTTVYRPIGAVYYAAVYSASGFDPFSLRAVTYAFALFNVVLVFLLSMRLFDSLEIAGLSALLFSVHPRMIDIYQNNGTVYDIVACSLCLLAVLVYDAGRRTRKLLTVRRALALLILVVAAINSKEIALSLPFVLIAYEFATGVWRRRWSTSTAMWLMALVAVSVIAAHVKMGPASVLHGNASYAPRFEAGDLNDTVENLVEWSLNARPNSVSYRDAWLAVAAVGIAVCIVGDWRIRFVSTAAVLLSVPVLFIEWRGLFVFYVPYAFFVIAFVALVIGGREAICARLRVTPETLQILRGVFIFSAVVAAMSFQWPMRAELLGPPEQRYINRMQWQFQSLRVARSPGSILVLNAKADYPWMPLMLARMRFNEPHLRVDNETAGQCDAGKTYDIVLDIQQNDGVLRDTKAPGSGYCNSRPAVRP
jgi:hypothetical protein